MNKFTKLAAIAMLMVADMPGAAQDNVGVLKVPGSNASVWSKTQNDYKFVETKSQDLVTVPNTTPQIKADGNVKVTFNLIADNAYVNQVMVYGMENTNQSWAVWESSEGYVIELQAGEYDMIAEFGDYNDGSPILVLKEELNITCDTIIEFNSNDATPLNIKAYNPDGELFVTDVYGYDENWEPIIIEKGNIGYAASTYDIVRKSDLKGVASGITGSIKNIRINDLSDRYMYTEHRIYYNNDAENAGIYFVKFYDNGADKLLENNASDYIYHEEEFASSKAGLSSDKGMSAYYDYTYNGMYFYGGGFDLGIGDKLKLWTCAPLESQTKNERIDMIPRPAISDVMDVEIIEIKDGDGNVIFSYENPIIHNIYAPAFVVENGVGNYVNNGPIAMVETLNFMNSANTDGIKVIYPGNPTFSFLQDDMGGRFGDNTPINLFYQDEMLEALNCAFLGRYGEYRDVDNYAMNMRLVANGEEITMVNGWEGPEELNYSNINNYFSEWMNPDRIKGVIEFTFDNQNIIVDDLQGRNLTTVVYDETKEDHYAPTMTMLQMRDANGMVTDRFETAQDGKVTFACGDFKICTGNFNYYWFECDRPNVEVSVAPYGDEDWQTLRIIEDTDAFAMPGFGHVFNADITLLYNEGWYDLKFKLTDAAGNMQEQTVSPAFRIGNGTSTSIDDVTSSDATEVARYTIDGRAISAPQTGVNIVKMSDGTVKKVVVK